MSQRVFVVDPLAVLFRPELTGHEALALDSTHVDVELLPPLARVAVTRCFTNRSNQIIEALLTLPPAVKYAVTYGLEVRINERTYRALARPAAIAQREQDAAMDAGRRTIRHELAAGGVQLISIAGIESNASVAVRIESVQPRIRTDRETALLSIGLSSDPKRWNHRLDDADAMTTTPSRHTATLCVTAEGLAVTLHKAEAHAPQPLASGESFRIDCADTIQLRVVSLGTRSLDHSAWHPEVLGGWQISLDKPLHPAASRSDWVHGEIVVGERCVHAIASRPLSTNAPLTANACAVLAFASSGDVEMAVPHDIGAMRREANVLYAGVNLAFVGAEGELPAGMPMLRKVALPSPPANPSEQRHPEVHFPEKLGPSITPQARPPSYRWIGWVLGILAAVLLINLVLLNPLPVLPLLGAFLVVSILNAIRLAPRSDAPVFVRLPLLTVFVLPTIAVLIGGEAISLPAFVASLVQPLLALPFFRGARKFTIAVGLLGVVCTIIAIVTQLSAKS